MKEIKLTKGFITLVDDEDYEYLNQRKWCISSCGYAITTFTINGKSKMVRMHRYLLNLTDPKVLIDHINHNRLDNQKKNLRTCNYSQSNMNTSVRGRSGFLGVHYKKRRTTRNGIDYIYFDIIARIKANGKYITLGRFKTIEEAAMAYDKAAQKYHGEFANLNFK
jgi:hypothetical protein